MENVTTRKQDLPVLAAHVEPELVAHVARIAGAHGISRSMLVRRALYYTLPLIDSGEIPALDVLPDLSDRNLIRSATAAR